MNRAPALHLLTGQTRHARWTPFQQRFAYRLVMVELDVDRLEDADRQTGLFSVERANLFGFRRRDHGARTPHALRAWAEKRLAEADVTLQGGSIRLVTFPRHLFYRFAPISVWLGHGPGGDLRGVIHEVNNTFGETHAYVARAEAPRCRHESDKRFHVSPFFDVSGQYRFTLNTSETHFGLVVETLENGARTHTATITAKRSPATSAGLARAAMTRPVSSLGVSFAIHWQALKLWARGAGYRGKPPPPQVPATTACPVARAEPTFEER